MNRIEQSRFFAKRIVEYAHNTRSPSPMQVAQLPRLETPPAGTDAWERFLLLTLAALITVASEGADYVRHADCRHCSRRHMGALGRRCCGKGSVKLCARENPGIEGQFDVWLLSFTVQAANAFQGSHPQDFSRLQFPVRGQSESASAFSGKCYGEGTVRHFDIPSIGDHLLSNTTRSYSGCVGRASCRYNFVNCSISSAVIATGCFRTNHVTFSLHGGVVSDPENVK